jgi:hypothetical protein
MNAIGIVFDEDGRVILRMKAAMRDFLLAVLPAAVEDGDVVKVDLTDLTAIPDRFAMIDDYPCMMLAFARIDDFPCKMTLIPLADIHGEKPEK